MPEFQLLWNFKFKDIIETRPGGNVSSDLLDTSHNGVTYKWKIGLENKTPEGVGPDMRVFVALMESSVYQPDGICARFSYSTFSHIAYVNKTQKFASDLMWRFRLCEGGKIKSPIRAPAMRELRRFLPLIASGGFAAADSDSMILSVTLSIRSEYFCGENSSAPDACIGSRFGRYLFDTIHSKKGDNDVVMLISNDGVEFECSKKILSMQSTVFETMFNDQAAYLEHETKKVVMDDVDGDTLKEFLRYVYTESIDEPKLQQSAPACLHVAEKYNVRRFKEICCRALRQQVKNDNAVDILLLADCYNAGDLKKSILQYIVANYKNIRQTGSWSKLKQNGALMEQILDAMSVCTVRELLKKWKCSACGKTRHIFSRCPMAGVVSGGGRRRNVNRD